MTAADKTRALQSLRAAATVGAGSVVVGATDGTRDVREAADADLDGLAGALASGDRGANELALKSELGGGTGGGNARGALLATSSALPQNNLSLGFSLGLLLDVGIGRPDGGWRPGTGAVNDRLHLPNLRPANNVDGLWVVSLVDGVEVSEAKFPWGDLAPTAAFNDRYIPLIFQAGVIGSDDALYAIAAYRFQTDGPGVPSLLVRRHFPPRQLDDQGLPGPGRRRCRGHGPCRLPAAPVR